MFAVGAALGLSGFFAVQHYFDVHWYGRGGLALAWAVLILCYAAGYPIYRGARRLATRSSTAAKPNTVARNLWRVCSIGAVVIVSMLAAFYPHGPVARPRSFKARADTLGIARAIVAYARHCSGLPAGDSRTDCPVTAEPGGPYFLPPTLLLRQTNTHGETSGPFLNRLPNPPTGWTGAGSSYAYYIFPEAKFLVCARGDGSAENSDGGKSCP